MIFKIDYILNIFLFHSETPNAHFNNSHILTIIAIFMWISNTI